MSEELHAFIWFHAPQLDAIDAGGGLACLCFELAPERHELAEFFGWGGWLPCFRMAEDLRHRFAQQLGTVGALGAQEWVESDRRGRVLVMYRRTVLLLNRLDDGAFSFQPETLPN